MWNGTVKSFTFSWSTRKNILMKTIGFSQPLQKKLYKLYFHISIMLKYDAQNEEICEMRDK